MAKKVFRDAFIKKKLKEFNEKEFLKILSEKINTFPKQLQLMIEEAMRHANNKVDLFYIKEWLEYPDIRLMPPVSVETFISDPHYLGSKTGNGEDIYPGVMNMAKDIIEGGYTQAVALCGIGAGKSFMGQIISCYLAHRLLCMHNARTSYGLALDKPITIVNMGLTSTQALEVVFSGIKKFIYGEDGTDGSPFFMQFKPQVQVGTIKFKKQGLLMFSGNSKVETVLGYNVYAAVLDEAAFYMDNDDKNIAQDIFDALQARIISRFQGDVGLVVAISSPRYEGDFITEKVKQAHELNKAGNLKNPHIYSIHLPTWKVKGVETADMENKFFFDVRKAEIIQGKTEKELIKEGRQINFVVRSGRITEEDDIWEVPGDYLNTFNENPEKAKRDYGALPSTSIAGYFTNLSKISEAFNMDGENPVVSPGVYKFPRRPKKIQYYIGIDIGFNRDGKGDHCGFAMGHGEYEIFKDAQGKEESRLRFHIDLAERIGMNEETGEVDLAAVRQRIYDLKAMGYNIKVVSFDQYASKDFRQIIEKKGFRTEYISVDRTTESYDIVKQAIYENRMDFSYYEPTLERELKQLEIIKGNKIDHPPKSQGGSKDLSDAVAQVCTSIVNHTPKGGLSFRNVISENNNESKHLQYYRKLRLKEKYYEKIKKQIEKQNEMEARILEKEQQIRNIQEQNNFQNTFL